MNHIVNNLWLGSQYDADELVRNNPEKITAILNVRGADAYNPPGRDQAAEHPGKAYKWISAADSGAVSPEHLKEALDWLQEQTDNGERILIHCRHGISRSPAFLAAFMVKSGISSSLEEAKATISVHRLVYPASVSTACNDHDRKRSR
jgi:diacylglycerol kinase (ATP)